MKKLLGITLSLSTFERGLWWDSDKREYEGRIDDYVAKDIKYTGGIRIHFAIGKMIRPIGKFWKLGFWRAEDKYNPWKGGEYLCVLRLPVVIGPFISFAIGNYGFYIGFKPFTVKPKHALITAYGRWLKQGEAGTEANPAVYLTPAVSFRRSRL